MKTLGIEAVLRRPQPQDSLVLTSCGGGEDAPADGDNAAEDGELTQVSIGVIPIVDVAPIYLGAKEGIFEEHGLELDLTLAQGGAAIIPAVQSGDFDFGFSNVTSLVIGQSQGLPLQLVAPGPQTTGNAEEDSRLCSYLKTRMRNLSRTSKGKALRLIPSTTSTTPSSRKVCVRLTAIRRR